jgi:flagellar P-ring protein FlgI
LVYTTFVKDGAILIDMLLKQITIKKIILILSISVFSNTVFADRIKDFADIAGQRPNQLVGYGLVVGLDGTGDQTTQTPFTLQSVLQMIGVLALPCHRLVPRLSYVIRQP